MAKNQAQKNNAGTPAKKEEKKDIVLVEFKRSFTPYVKGEVAGFDTRFADKLIDKGIAMPYKK